MSLFDFVGKFILFIIPGVISIAIISYLIGKKLSIDIINTVYIFTLSSVSYVICNFIIFIYNIFPHKNIKYANIVQIMSGDLQAINTVHIVLAIISSIMLGLTLTFLLSKNIIFKISNKLKITNRTDNDDIWDGLFNEQQWIIFRDYITTYSYYGRVKKVSDNKQDREIILEDVKVYDCEGQEFYTMKQIYFCRKASEFSIEIDNYNKGEINNATETEERLLIHTS